MEALLEVLHTIAHIVHPFEIALKKFSAILLITASPAASVGYCGAGLDKLLGKMEILCGMQNPREI